MPGCSATGTDKGVAPGVGTAKWHLDKFRTKAVIPQGQGNPHIIQIDFDKTNAGISTLQPGFCVAKFYSPIKLRESPCPHIGQGKVAQWNLRRSRWGI